MKKLIFLVLAASILTACANNTDSSTDAPTQNPEAVYMNITAEEAKEIMDTQTGYIILDTRTQEEYDEGHIPGAILIPYDEIAEKADAMLTDRNQLLLVYCRSGRRSKIAAETLVELGYTNIREFGGIIDWPYEIEK